MSNSEALTSEATTSADAFWQVHDEQIEAAIHSLTAAGMSITIAKITDQMTDQVVASYDNTTSLFVYKSSWCIRIAQILAKLNITYNKSRPNWENISMLINDKRLGLVRPVTNQFQNFANTSPSLTSSTISAPTSLDSYSSSTSKQIKLSPLQKEIIVDMFAKLNETKMWRLSTGTVVEQQMKIFALECNFEHPVHSMVLDVSDKSWLKYFTPEEIQEIKNHQKKVLVDLPSTIEDYIKKLRECHDVTVLKSMLKQELSDPGCEWIRSSLLQFIHLFKCNYLPLSTQTEGDMLRRIWFFIDTVFDYSKIDCRGGEKASKSSSAGRNAQRVIAGEDKMENKRMGRKVDLLFLRQRLEYGCAECGRYDDQTKELYDGSFKMLKVLKDMIYNLYKSAPTSLREFTLVGFLMFETKFTLVTCDVPMGYVTRVTPFKSIDLPEEADDLTNQLLSILKAVYRARLTMEQTNRKVRKEVIEVDEQSEEDSMIIGPSFNIEPNSNKRRKSNGESRED